MTRVEVGKWKISNNANLYFSSVMYMYNRRGVILLKRCFLVYRGYNDGGFKILVRQEIVESKLAIHFSTLISCSIRSKKRLKLFRLESLSG
jgi:hypothetical protein